MLFLIGSYLIPIDFLMMSRSVKALFLVFVAALPIVLAAQETTGIEDERMQELMARNAEAEQWFGPRNKVSVGFRFLTSGGTVATHATWPVCRPATFGARPEEPKAVTS